jgi:hypothetical protein
MKVMRVVLMVLIVSVILLGRADAPRSMAQDQTISDVCARFHELSGIPSTSTR